MSVYSLYLLLLLLLLLLLQYSMVRSCHTFNCVYVNHIMHDLNSNSYMKVTKCFTEQNEWSESKGLRTRADKAPRSVTISRMFLILDFFPSG